MSSAVALGRETFSSLRNPNYRRYFRGQAISQVGTWMQGVAQSWLVLELTGSGTQVGVVVALQALPVLLFGAYGGVVADRVDKRKLMIWLQSTMGVLALILGLLTVTHVVVLWEIYALAFALGLNNCFENPARQSFVLELVGPADLRNAVSLNSVLLNAARAVGPAAAGAVIAAGGTGVCFLINAASFVAVVVSLIRLDVDRLQPSPPALRTPGQLREGLRYVAATPRLAVPLVMMAFVGCLAFEFQVVLPVVARDTFHGGAQVYGFMTGAMGLGAVVGGLYIAARGRTGTRALIVSSALFGSAILLAALAPVLAVEYVALLIVGAAGVAFMSKANTTLQLGADPSMRGRVMALWAVAFMGSTPIGGPIAGAVAEHAGGRAGLLLGAGACFVAAGLGLTLLRRVRARSSDQARTADQAEVAARPVAGPSATEAALTAPADSSA